MIVNYDRTTGARLWSYDISADGAARTFHGHMARIGDLLLVPSDPAEGHVYALRELDGELVWKWPSGSGVSSDLLVRQNLVFAVTLDNELVALDLDSGSEVWRRPGTPGDRIARVTPTPIILGETLIWGRGDGQLSCLDPASGAVHWTTTLAAGIATDLTQFAGRVILGRTDGVLVEIDPADGRTIIEADLGLMPTYRWLAAEGLSLIGMTGITGSERRLVGVDKSTLETRWMLAAPDSFRWTTAQPALGWDLVLAGTNEPALYGIDPVSGSVHWKAATEKAPRTIKVVGDDIFIGTFEGTLLAYRR